MVVLWCLVWCGDGVASGIASARQDTTAHKRHGTSEKMRKVKPIPPLQFGEVPRVGGWRGSPNSIAALLRCQVPYAEQRHCARCRCIAVRGYDHCQMHLGRWSPKSGAFGRAESRFLRKLERVGLLPTGLIELPVWRGLMGLPTKVRAPMRLALVRAWDRRGDEPLNWARVMRQAHEAGTTLEKPRNAYRAPWFENL